MGDFGSRGRQNTPANSWQILASHHDVRVDQGTPYRIYSGLGRVLLKSNHGRNSWGRCTRNNAGSERAANVEEHSNFFAPRVSLVRNRSYLDRPLEPR
jgi:hypothetical protein